MVTKAADLVKIPTLGRVEKSGLIVTAILVAVNALVGSPELAVGAGAGGVLFVANFVAIKFVVNTLIGNGNAYPKAFGIFAFLIKMAVFIGIVVSIFIFAKVNIYGFFIGVTGVVIVIIGEGLKGYKNGAL